MVDFDRPRLQFTGSAMPRQIIGALALDLYGGVLRRGLLDHPGELRQQVGNRLGSGPDFAGFDDPALGIVGIALFTPAHRKAVALAAVHHERNGLGGFAQGDRQAPGGERIERAGMARPLGLEQPLHDCDRLRRLHADRLVERDPAVDVTLVAPRLVIWARLLAGVRAIFAVKRVRRNIFFSAVRITDRRFDHAVYGGHNHQVTLPNLANLVRGLFAPQVFAVISLFVPPRRIVHQRENEYQAQILS